jgi:hypothetical protein
LVLPGGRDKEVGLRLCVLDSKGAPLGGTDDHPEQAYFK